MTASLIYRVTKLISGSAHAIVGKMENMAPELVMEQSIREMECVLDELRQELGQTLASKHLANRKLSEKNDKHVELAGKIEEAIRQGREGLAEVAVSAQLDIEAQIPVLEKAIADFCEKERELESYIAALEAKRREMKQELLNYQRAKSTTQGELRASESVKTADSHKKAQKAISHFDNIMEKQTGLVGFQHDPQSAKKLQELENFSRQNRIKERIEAIKKSQLVN